MVRKITSMTQLHIHGIRHLRPMILYLGARVFGFSNVIQEFFSGIVSVKQFLENHYAHSQVTECRLIVLGVLGCLRCL